MEAIDKSGGAYSYRFLGFGKALEKKMNVFKTEVLKNALKNYQGG